jgi:hypothetical protein
MSFHVRVLFCDFKFFFVGLDATSRRPYRYSYNELFMITIQ